MKKILVTGGEGYIGSNIVKQLLENNYYVISYDNFTNSFKTKRNYKNYKFIKGDIRDSKKIDKIFHNNKVDLVVHCAALISVGESVLDPIKYYEVNTCGTTNLIRLMHKNNIKKIIFSSTAATYGLPKENKPIIEKDIQSPINPYGQSKLAAEKIILDAKVYGIESILFRYFNVAGSDKDNKLFYKPRGNSSHIIPIVNDYFLGKRSEFKIYGNNYNTKDGTCVRDYVHVKDLANAHVLGVNYLIENNKSNIFNISSGKGFSNLDIFKAANKIHGKNLKPEFGDKRDGDPDYLVASNRKIKKELNWIPKYGIEDMIKDDLEKE